MKKLHLLLIAFLAISFNFLSSCDVEPELPESPTITFTQPTTASVQVYKGDSYTFEGTVKADPSSSLSEIKFFNGATEYATPHF